MNITDIDDKIIKGATAAGSSIGELADRYLDALPGRRRSARDDPPRRHAAGDRAHRRDRRPSSGRCSNGATPIEPTTARSSSASPRGPPTAGWPGSIPRQLRVGERVEADEYAKDDVRDFALWKGPKPGEPSWSTAIGDGRPGWHIECSAMSMAHLGPSFDLHTGGVDLIFPHHEDEIAQSEAATGQPFVGTWLHCAHLQMGGEKMAKSTGNIARVRELLDDGRLAAGAALRADRRPLPSEPQSLAGLAGGGRGRARPAAMPRLPRWPATTRTGPTIRRCRRRSRRRARSLRGRARRRPQRVRGTGGRVRPRPRGQSPDRGAIAVDGRRRADRGDVPRPRPGPRRPAPADGRRCRATSRPCSTSGPPRARRATGRRPTGCATSSPTGASWSRTPATASAGGGVAEVSPWLIGRADDGPPERPPKRHGSGRGPGRPVRGRRVVAVPDRGGHDRGRPPIRLRGPVDRRSGPAATTARVATAAIDHGRPGRVDHRALGRRDRPPRMRTATGRPDRRPWTQGTAGRRDDLTAVAVRPSAARRPPAVRRPSAARRPSAPRGSTAATVRATRPATVRVRVRREPRPPGPRSGPRPARSRPGVGPHAPTARARATGPRRVAAAAAVSGPRPRRRPRRSPTPAALPPPEAARRGRGARRGSSPGRGGVRRPPAGAPTAGRRPSAGRRSRSSSSTPRACASRSSRSRAAR